MKNKLNFFLSALLVLLFGTLSSTCLATNLTLSEFREICDIPSSVEIPSELQTIITTDSPVIIKSQDSSLIHIYPISSTISYINSNVSNVGWQGNFSFFSTGSSPNTYFYFSPNFTFTNNPSTTWTKACYVYNISTQTFSTQTWINMTRRYSFSNDQVGARFGLKIDSNNQTDTQFKSLANLKTFLMDNLLFTGFNNLVYGGQNVLYRFNGVYTGNNVYTSKFTTNLDNFKFNYEAYSNSENYSVVNYYYLQKFSPNEALQLTDIDTSFSSDDYQLRWNKNKTESFSFNGLINLMEEGYIYRLYAFSNQHNASGDLIRTADATSQFFSLNSWKSSEIEVLNIYELLFTDNPSIEDTGGGPSGGVIDLENIENSINNANKDYWGKPDDIKPEDFENELENNFNGIMESLSGELSQNQIFESLQGAENGFLNFFKEEQNEQFYDLAFSWPDVEFMGGVLIPAGGINISEMCREIPELEQLRSIIRVIFNFSVAVSLIKQIYNLILSTLGIDNPYLYENYDEVTAIDTDTGEYKEMAYKRKRIYNRRR